MTSRLPIPGQDDGTWGQILNDFLLQSHNADGTIKSTVLAGISGLTDPTTSKGDLVVHGSSTTRLPVGSDGTVLTADSSSSLGVTWAAAPSGGGSLADGSVTTAKITSGGLAPTAITGTALVSSQLGVNNGVASLDSNGKLSQPVDATKITSGTLNAARIPDLSATYATAGSVSGKLDQTTADGRYIRTVNNSGPDANGNVAVKPGATFVSWDGTGSVPTRPSSATGEVNWSFPANHDPASQNGVTVQDGDTWEYTVTSTQTVPVNVRGTASKYVHANVITINTSDFSVAPQAGDLLVAFVWMISGDYNNGAVGITDVNNGWTVRKTKDDTIYNYGFNSGAVYTRTVTANESPYTFSSTGSDNAMVAEIYALRGADTATVLDGVAASSSNSGSPLNAPSVTATTGANSLLLNAWGSLNTSQSTGVSFTTPAGVMKDMETGGWGISQGVGVGAWAATAHSSLSSAGATGVKGATVNTSDLGIMFSLAILAGPTQVTTLVQLWRRGGVWLSTSNGSGSGTSAVSSVAGRTGDVILTSNDITGLNSQLANSLSATGFDIQNVTSPGTSNIVPVVGRLHAPEQRLNVTTNIGTYNFNSVVYQQMLLPYWSQNTQDVFISLNQNVILYLPAGFDDHGNGVYETGFNALTPLHYRIVLQQDNVGGRLAYIRPQVSTGEITVGQAPGQITYLDLTWFNLETGWVATNVQTFDAAWRLGNQMDASFPINNVWVMRGLPTNQFNQLKTELGYLSAHGKTAVQTANAIGYASGDNATVNSTSDLVQGSLLAAPPFRGFGGQGFAGGLTNQAATNPQWVSRLINSNYANWISSGKIASISPFAALHEINHVLDACLYPSGVTGNDNKSYTTISTTPDWTSFYTTYLQNNSNVSTYTATNRYEAYAELGAALHYYKSTGDQSILNALLGGSSSALNAYLALDTHFGIA